MMAVVADTLATTPKSMNQNVRVRRAWRTVNSTEPCCGLVLPVPSPLSDDRDAASPSGLSPMSSGLLLITRATGMVSRKIKTPMTRRVSRQPKWLIPRFNSGTTLAPPPAKAVIKVDIATALRRMNH